MKERPILFSAPMVRAILDGRKTQTRRVVMPIPEPAPPEFPGEHWWRCSAVRSCVSIEKDLRGPDRSMAECLNPYGQPGDRLWVKETWADVNLEGAPGIAYRADGHVLDLMSDPTFLDDRGAFNYEEPRYRKVAESKQGNCFAAWSADLIAGVEGRWRSSRFLPRWASRITLEVTGVRVERLQEISEADAEAEGINRVYPSGSDEPTCIEGPGGYRWLWDSINGAGAWAANPWVWVVEFKRIAA